MEHDLYSLHEAQVEGGDPRFAPNTVPASYTIQPQLLRRDDELGVVGVLTQKGLRTAMLDGESRWTLGMMFRGLLTDSRPRAFKRPEVEKLVAPAWAVELLAALGVPTFFGKPIERRSDELDIWELRWIDEPAP